MHLYPMAVPCRSRLNELFPGCDQIALDKQFAQVALDRQIALGKQIAQTALDRQTEHIDRHRKSNALRSQLEDHAMP